MNRELLLEHLAQAEQLIGNGECEAIRLRQKLVRLTDDDATAARQALQQCEQSQALHRAERTRLLAELSARARPC